MKVSTKSVFPAVGCILFLSACGGSGGGSGTPAGQTFDPDPEPAVSFFNDDAGTDFVNATINRFVGVFSPISSLLGGGGTSDDSSGDSAKRAIARTETETESCADGGTFTVSSEFDDVTDEQTAVSISIDNCIEDGETGNGDITVNLLDAPGDVEAFSLTADNLTITGGDEDIALDGTVNLQDQFNNAGSTFSISGPNLSVTAGSETIVLSDYSITVIENDFEDTAELSASVTVASSVDGMITLVIDPPLSSDSDAEFPLSGTITMTHADGSSLTLNADNGNPETFDFTINDNGSITSGSQRWDETDLDEL